MDSAVPWVPRGIRGNPRGAETMVPRGGKQPSQGIVAAGSRVAPERSVGEGDLEAQGTAPLPAALRPRGQVPATGLAQELGCRARDLGEVVSCCSTVGSSRDAFDLGKGRRGAGSRGASRLSRPRSAPRAGTRTGVILDSWHAGPSLLGQPILVPPGDL